MTFYDSTTPLIITDPITSITYNYVNVLDLNVLPIPTIFKPGVEFKVVSVPPSLNASQFLMLIVFLLLLEMRILLLTRLVLRLFGIIK